LKMKKHYKFLITFLICCFLWSIPEFFHKNTVRSKAFGTRSNGTLENAWLMPYSGNNFESFSFISYYFWKNAYTHSTIHDILLDAYVECETTCPDIQFRYMECSNKKGGKMAIHRTHRNGTSVDFMVPKKRGGEQSTIWDRIGLLHYLLEFSTSGKLIVEKYVDNSARIDFETSAKHILALDNAARKRGWKIKMVILKLNLKDDFFKTPSGKKVKARGIYFARNLQPIVDRMHDDHYHIDFERIKK